MASVYELKQKALTKDCAESFYQVGESYLFGDNGANEDAIEAVKWYNSAVKKGHAEATRRLAAMHESGMFPGADKRECVRLTRKLVNELNEPSDIIYLGTLYCRGDGVTKNESEGLKLIYNGVDGADGKFYWYEYEAAMRLVTGGAQIGDRKMLELGIDSLNKILSKHAEKITEKAGIDIINMINELLYAGKEALKKIT